jgi:hypothetical protein
MANEFTLASYELTATDNLSKAIARTWREASPILDMLSFKTSGLLSQKFLRYDNLPTVPWRKIGETFANLTATPNNVEERLYFMGGKIDTPYEYVKADSMVDVRAMRTEAVMKGAAFGFNEAFFTNTPLVDEDAPVGLWYRLVNDLPSTQNFDAALDVSPDTAATSWQHKMFDQVDDLLDRVDGTNNQKHLFMGRTLYRRFISALRSANQLFTSRDEDLGKDITQYGPGGAMIHDVGYKVTAATGAQSTPILGDVETAFTDLTGGAKSSMYAVRFGEPYVSGWCQEMPNAEDVGLTEDRVNYRTVVRWSPGLYIVNPRSAAVAYGWTAS